MAQQQPTCWYSYAEHDGPGQGPGRTAFGSCFMVSVVLDAGAQKFFSGIRLVLVAEENEGMSGELDGLVIRDCLDPGKYNIVQSGPPRPRLCRVNLDQRRRALLHDTHNPRDHLLPCITVFEIVDLPISGRAWLIPKSPVALADRYRVVYDRTYPSSSVCALLESSLSFRPVCDWSTGFYHRSTPQPGIPSFSMRIYPVHADHSCLTLPISIVRLIVTEAILSTGREWRSNLLAYGLVCRSWASVLDLFYRYYCTKNDQMAGGFELERSDNASAVAIARSLVHHPERAKLIPRFAQRDYGKPEEGAILSILELATHIRTIEIWPVYSSLFPSFLNTLRQPRQVTSCKIFGVCGTDSRTDLEDITIRDIQGFIAGWGNLSTLEIALCGSGMEEIKDMKRLEMENPPRPAGNLKRLTLTSCRLALHQLPTFVSSPQPCLAALTLSQVRVHNNDMLKTFLLVSSSLMDILLISCRVERSSADEELAIDAAVSKMANLRSLSILGQCASELCIERCPAAALPSGTSSGSGEHDFHEANLYFCVEGLDPEAVLRALRVCRWKHVVIDSNIRHADSLVKEMRDVASARGMTLSIK